MTLVSLGTPEVSSPFNMTGKQGKIFGFLAP